MLFDTHAHLDDERYDDDRDEVIIRAEEKGIKFILNVGFDMASSKRALSLANRYDFIYAAVGIHPHDASEAKETTLSQLKELAQQDKVVALGEMGLDYYRNLSPKDIQQQAFRDQIRLAKELQKPIIVHDREAHGDILQILKEEGAQEVGGILHCFSGSWEMAKECMALNFYISIAGPVTFNNAKKLQGVAEKMPLDKLLIETDAPYLTPEPFRGKRNESAHVYYVAEKIAELKGINIKELGQATTANARKLFGI